MEKFLLRTFLTYDKLDIIDQKDIVIPVFFTEFRCGYIVFISDRIDQFIGKLLACDIQNFGLRIILENKMADGVHKMSFAKTNSSIYKKAGCIFHLEIRRQPKKPHAPDYCWHLRRNCQTYIGDLNWRSVSPACLLPVRG